MLARILNTRNITILVSSTLCGTFLLFLFFIEKAQSNYSYLVFQSNGEVTKRLNTAYAYNQSISMGFVALACFVALGGFWLLMKMTKDNLKVKKDDSPIVLANAVDDEDLAGENVVFYGHSPISEDIMKEFVQLYPESAVKFVFRRNIDGSNLDPLIFKLHNDWISRGMKPDAVRNEIVRIVNDKDLDNRDLYDLTLDIRNKSGHDTKDDQLSSVEVDGSQAPRIEEEQR